MVALIAWIFVHRTKFLQTQSSRVTEYDEQMVRRLIEKITVFDDKLIFKFKSGMSIEARAYLEKILDIGRHEERNPRKDHIYA